MRTRTPLATPLATVAALTLATAALAGSAAAHPATNRAKPTVTVLAKKLVGPLRVATAANGTVYFTDDFAGALYSQAPGATTPTLVYQGTKNGGGAEAVSVSGNLVTFALNAARNTIGKLYTLPVGAPSGTAPTELADLGAYEVANNPDHAYHYGFHHLPRSCAAQVPKQIPVSYTGVKETHPYATTTLNGVTYVADAGANAIFAVTPTGTVSTLATLKPVQVRISASGAKANHVPSCAVGKRYGFEAVPTDIQAGPDGLLYVTSLPGGTEDASLGANGRVLRVNPATGTVSTVVGGLAGPTGLAVVPDGDIYVTQLFAGEIDKIAAGTSKAKPFLRVPLPADVSPSASGLVATVNAISGKKPMGQVVSITP